MTPEQKRAYVLADNKLAMNAGWDEELLAEELKGASHARKTMRQRPDLSTKWPMQRGACNLPLLAGRSWRQHRS